MVDEADHNFEAISVSPDKEDDSIVRDLPPKKYFPDASYIQTKGNFKSIKFPVFS